jgi:hypothetical protein
VPANPLARKRFERVLSMSVEAIPAAQRGGLDQKWKVLISVMFGVFMIILDSTIVNVAFPTLRREYGACVSVDCPI